MPEPSSRPNTFLATGHELPPGVKARPPKTAWSRDWGIEGDNQAIRAAHIQVIDANHSPMGYVQSPAKQFAKT